MDGDGRLTGKESSRREGRSPSSSRTRPSTSASALTLERHGEVVVTSGGFLLLQVVRGRLRSSRLFVGWWDVWGVPFTSGGGVETCGEFRLPTRKNRVSLLT